MKNTNVVSRSDREMHDMNEALSEFFTELDTLDKLKSGITQKENDLRMTQSKDPIIKVARSVEYIAKKLKAVSKLGMLPNITSMFHIY